MLKKNIIRLLVTTCIITIVLPLVASSSSGRIILIHGISSGGKTSVAQELASQMGTSKTLIMNSDQHMRAHIDQKALELGYNLNEKKQPWWQDFWKITEHFTDQARKDFKLQLWQSFFTTIKNAALQGNMVIVDTIDIPLVPLFLENMRGMQVTLVLVYTPLNFIIKFLEQRNTDAADTYNKRSLLISLMQYQNVFKPVAHKDDPVIDYLDIPSAMHYLDCMNQEIDTLTAKPENFEEKFIKHFQLDQVSSVSITPVLPYDIIMHGAQLSVSERAEMLKTLLKI